MKRFALGQGVRLKSGGPLMTYGGTLGNTDLAYLTGIVGTQTYSSTVAEDQLEAVEHETDTLRWSVEYRRTASRAFIGTRSPTSDVQGLKNCRHTG